MKIAVVGTGKVGLPFAAVCSKYYETIGVDVSSEIVRRINDRGDFSEPLLNEYLAQHRFNATTDFGLIDRCDIVFICVGSQSPGEGYSAKNLMRAMDQVGPHLVSKTQVLVIMTTLPLTTFEDRVITQLSSRGVENRVLGICYNPTMIALGNAIRDFERPNYLLIGESSPKAGDRLQEFWTRIVGDKVPVFRSTLANIEVAKYALNTALVLKITLMNALTELCEKSGADIDFQAEVFAKNWPFLQN